MKHLKITLLSFISSLILIVSLLFYSCDKDYVEPLQEEIKCASDEILEQDLKRNPELRAKLIEMDRRAENFIPSKAKMVNDILQVPVVVYVIWRTSTENIPLGQIQSQIDVLNEDFSGNFSEVSKIPPIFQPVNAGDTKIRFYLDTVIRKQTTVTSWSTDRKIQWDSCGGKSIPNETESRTKLHIWVGTLVSGLSGFAQFPGCAWQTDGVVINNKCFGSRQKFPSGTYMTSMDLGRTTVHEVGHYFFLRHVWGSGNCGNDFCDDTPPVAKANYYCPSFPRYSTCTGFTSTPMMTMNHMDYCYDACSYMFTNQQKLRMQSTFAVGGLRATLR